MFTRNFTCVLTCVLCLLSCPWALLRKAWLCLLYPFPPGIYTLDKIPGIIYYQVSQELIYIDKILLEDLIHIDKIILLFSRLRSPSTCSLSSCQMFQSLNHLCNPAMGSPQQVCTSLAKGNPQLHTDVQLQQLKEGSSPSTCWQCFS